MDKFQGKYRIPSARATWWDYAGNGLYFITICTAGRAHCFGKIAGDEMQLSPIGEMALQCWLEIPHHFPFVKLHAFVVMPNHVHGILEIARSGLANNELADTHPVETQNFASLQQYPPPPSSPSPSPPPSGTNKFGPQSRNLSSIIRGYKIGVKKYATMNKIDFTWQSRFHDHIIRNDHEYHRIHDYIIKNPGNWKRDIFLQQ
jgi:REP element-mobilizing transposase RayT